MLNSGKLQSWKLQLAQFKNQYQPGYNDSHISSPLCQDQEIIAENLPTDHLARIQIVYFDLPIMHAH